MKLWLIAIATLLLASTPVHAKREMPERWYANHWCQSHGGRTEVRNPDRTRTDCATLGYAIEVDFADRWYQAIGQALHYAEQQEKMPGMLLVVEKPDQCRYVRAARMVLLRTTWNHLKHGAVRIELWTIGADVHCEGGSV